MNPVAGMKSSAAPGERNENLPDVVPEHQEHGDAAQPVEDAEPRTLVQRPASGH